MLTRWCGDAKCFAMQEPTMWFHSANGTALQLHRNDRINSVRFLHIHSPDGSALSRMYIVQRAMICRPRPTILRTAKVPHESCSQWWHLAGKTS